jgi:hypothetical protein
MRRDSSALRRLTTTIRGRAHGCRRTLLGTALVATTVASFAGCTVAQRSGQASSYFIINSLQASSGATPDEFGSVLSSDVLTYVKSQQDGKEVRVPTIFADNGQVVLTLALKNPGTGDTATTPSTTNFITINRYHVDYIRSDGRDRQGVDVPYSFDGAITATVTDEGGSASFTLVRIQAKQEAPLVQMAGFGGAIDISTIARVTFYGTDQAGREVSGTGQISINFSDWGDPQ